MNEIRVRPATAEDSPVLQEIFNAETETSTSVWDWSPLSAADWQRWIEDHEVVVVAEVDSRIAGFAGYGGFRTQDGYASTAENSVFVREGMRGQGVGKKLLEGLLEAARARGVHVVVAAVSSDNLASLSLHLSSGFVRVGYLPEVGQKFGRWLDLVLLQAILDSRTSP